MPSSFKSNNVTTRINNGFVPLLNINIYVNDEVVNDYILSGKNLSVYSWHSKNYETNMHGYILLAMTDFACVVRVKYNTEGKENFFTHID